MRDGIGNNAVGRLGDDRVHGSDQILIVRLFIRENEEIVVADICFPGRDEKIFPKPAQFFPWQPLEAQAAEAQENNGCRSGEFEFRSCLGFGKRGKPGDPWDRLPAREDFQIARIRQRQRKSGLAVETLNLFNQGQEVGVLLQIRSIDNVPTKVRDRHRGDRGASRNLKAKRWNVADGEFYLLAFDKLDFLTDHLWKTLA